MKSIISDEINTLLKSDDDEIEETHSVRPPKLQSIKTVISNISKPFYPK